MSGLCACQDFLEEDTRGIINPNDFYASDEEAILAANGLYRGLTSGVRGNNGRMYGFWVGIQFWTIYGADEVGPNRQQGLVEPIQNYTLTESNYGNARDIWQSLYRTVGDANSVLANTADNPSLSDDIRNRGTGRSPIYTKFYLLSPG